MANIDNLDLMPRDQFDFELMLQMDVDPFLPVAGFNVARPRPQPDMADQNHFVGFLSYNTTFHQSMLAQPSSPLENLRRDSPTITERQSPPSQPSQPGGFEIYVASQYYDAPAWSDTSYTTAVVGFNDNDSTMNYASQLTNRSGSGASNANQASSRPNRTKNKRKLEDHIGCFSVSNNTEGSRRKRRAFDPATRKEVALMRKIKPCSRCKARRVKCQFPGPCQACRDAAESITLAIHICNRQTLLDLRFGETGFDFLSQFYTEELLKTEIGAFHGNQRTIACDLVFRGSDIITQKPLLLVVQDYFVPDINAPPLESECLVGYDGSTPIFETVRSGRYALAPESLPTVKQLLDWTQLDVHSPNESTVKRFMLSLGEFMERYCAEQPEVPMYEMLNSAVTILKLLRCWRNCKMTTSPDHTGAKQHISRTVVSQLLLIIKDGIRAAELTLLDHLENLVYSSKGPGKNNIIPLWTTLWTLILTYRDCMTTYKFSQHCTISFEHDAAKSQDLIEASKHMYHILTSVYAALFKASTPLYLDWREGSNMELLGNSEVLKYAFIALRTEVEWFYGQKHRLGNEDARLKDEIIEQEQRLKPKYPTSVMVRRVRPVRVEDNVVRGCLAGVNCHFDH